MENSTYGAPNNSGQLLRLEIRQKNIYTKKRKVKTWSPEQDDQLVKLYEMHPKKWGVIASLMQDRNENQCLHRYRRLSQLGAHKKIWSAEEDHTILSLIKKIGKNWKLLAQIIGTKTGKQIRQRFINKLDPKIKTDQWTDQQDKLILKYYSQVGSKWSEISKKLPGRPENKIKNRFYSYIQKNYDIKYVYVDENCSIENQNKKQLIQRKDKFKQQKQLINENLKPLSLDYKIQQQASPKQKSFLQQLDLNKKNSKPQQIKKIRKNRLKPSYSRFRQEKNNENIYEDDMQQTEKISEIKQITKIQKKEKLKIQKKSYKVQNSELPSIKQLQDQFKVSQYVNQSRSKQEIQNINSLVNYEQENVNQQKDQIFDSNVNIQLGQKYYIKSLIRVEDEMGNNQNRYRSIRDLVSNNQIQNHQNELFYLSHN